MMMVDDADFFIKHFFMSHTFDKIYFIETFNWIAKVTRMTGHLRLKVVVIHPGSFVLMLSFDVCS